MIGCTVPFTTIYVHSGGMFSTCCPTWEDESSLCHTDGTASPASVWNSRPFVKLREAWLAGNERLCVRCPLRATRDKNVFGELPSASGVMQQGPRRIYVNDDNICNLHCWTCRKECNGHLPGWERQQQTTRRMIEAFLPGATWLSMLHCGELFASSYHLDILSGIDVRQYPELRIEIFTNGVLLPRKWPDISNVHPAINQVTMSIDAASREVYEQVRAPARWEQLQATLAFVRSLRESGQIERFQCNFVARRINFREIIPFASMCLDHAATKVRYSVFDKTWQTDAEHAAEIPYADPEFAEIVNSPALDRPEINVSILRAVANGAAIVA